MTNTHAATPSSKLRLPTGRQVYDGLMSKIEPELVTAVLPTLKAKYKNESAGDRAKRFKRYSVAHAKYKQAYALWIGKLHAAAEKYRRKALKRAEEKERGADMDIMQRLEASFAEAATK